MTHLIKSCLLCIIIHSICFADNQEEAKIILEKAFDVLNNRTYTLDWHSSMSLQAIKEDSKDVIKQLVKPDGTVLKAMVMKEWTSPSKRLVSQTTIIWKDNGCYHLTNTPRTPQTSFCIFSPEPLMKKKLNPANHYVLKKEKAKINGTLCHVIVSTAKNGVRVEYFVDSHTGYLLCDKDYGKNGNLFGQSYYLNYNFEPNLTEDDFAIPEGIKIHTAKNEKEYQKLDIELNMNFVHASRPGNGNRQSRGGRIGSSFSEYAASGRLVDNLLKYTPYIACGVAVIAAGAAIMLKIKAKKQ